MDHRLEGTGLKRARFGGEVMKGGSVCVGRWLKKPPKYWRCLYPISTKHSHSVITRATQLGQEKEAGNTSHYPSCTNIYLSAQLSLFPSPLSTVFFSRMLLPTTAADDNGNKNRDLREKRICLFIQDFKVLKVYSLLILFG